MDDLEKLLAKADAPAPPAQADLAGVVRGIVVARRRRRRFAVAITALLLAAGVGVAVVMPHPHGATDSTAMRDVDVKACREEIVELEAQARLHSRVAQAIERARELEHRPENMGPEQAEFDVLMQVDQRRQVAAQLMLRHAEQIRSEHDDRDAITASYKKVVGLFPDTLASRVAEDYLRDAGL